MKVGIYRGKGAAQKSADAISEVLSEKWEVAEFWDDLPPVDVLVIGGGSASEIASSLGRETLNLVERSVKSGSVGYVGICAGAYLAIEGYWTDKTLTGEIVLLNAHHPDIDRWNRGKGWVKVRLTGWLGSGAVDMWYENGPLFFGEGYEILGVFEGDVNEIGSPVSMKGSPAIVHAPGVVLFSPHPEFSGEIGRWLLIEAVRRVSYEITA